MVKIPASTPRAAEPTLRIPDVVAKRSAGHFIIALPFEVLEIFFPFQFFPLCLFFWLHKSNLAALSVSALDNHGRQRI